MPYGRGVQAEAKYLDQSTKETEKAWGIRSPIHPLVCLFGSRLCVWLQALLNERGRSASQVVALMGCNSMERRGHSIPYLFCTEPPGDPGVKQLRFAEEDERTVFVLSEITVGPECVRQVPCANYTKP